MWLFGVDRSHQRKTHVNGAAVAVKLSFKHEISFGSLHPAFADVRTEHVPALVPSTTYTGLMVS
jgi:hypothetical protein